MKLYLGLDIGASTVGFSLIDADKKEIIHAGTSVFPKSDPSNNQARRDSRGARRRFRRKSYRVEKINRLIKKYNIKENNEMCLRNPYEVKVDALSNPISEAELVYILKHYVKHRGIDYLTEEEEENASKEGIKIDTGTSDKRFICEKELERFNKFIELERSGSRIDDLYDIGVRNGGVIYSKYDYKKEILEILRTQSKFNSKITEEFINEYINIFMSKRKYYEGPGTERDRTDYGIYRENNDTWDNLSKSLIGKCSIYGDEGEKRAPKLSYTAQEFNLLNDLNNLKLGEFGRRLSREEKEKIVKEVVNSDKVSMLKLISSVSGEPKETIEGFRIDTKGKETFHKFDGYRTINKKVKEVFGIDDITKEEFNILADEISLDGEEAHIQEVLLSNPKLDRSKFTPEIVLYIMRAAKKISNNEVKGWHSLSYRVMEEVMEELYDTSKNQQQIFSERGLLDLKIKKYKGKHKIPVDDILEDMLSPVAKRSFLEAVEIINEFVKKYGQLDGIVIEMARNIYKSDEELKKELNKRKSENDAAKKEIQEFCATHGIPFDNSFVNKKSIDKFKFWKMQDELCLYSLKKISFETLMYDITGVKGGILEIDHIIPRSISFDDSLDNRVLVYREENQKKGSRTPYQYIPKVKWGEYEKAIKEISGISRKKKDLLLIKEDITKPEILSGFINRNIVDTSYSCRSVLNLLQGYVKANNLPTKVHSVKGGFTSMIRNSLGLVKNRDYYKNHAEDATIVAFVPNMKIMDIYADLKKRYLEENNHTKRGSILNDEEFVKMLIDSDIIKIKNEIQLYDYKYRHKIDKKCNRQLTDETIVSTREIDGVLHSIRKCKNIYGKDGEKIVAKIKSNDEKELSKLLVYRNDYKTYEILKDIVEMYPNEKNPFAKYKEEHGFIRKYSKKGNGPVIKSLAYAERKLGNCLDISHKYGHSKNSKRVVMNSVGLYRVDVYCKDGKYKTLEIPYTMFKFNKNKYVLDIEKYEDKKDIKGIDSEYEFKFSLYTNSIILIEGIDGTEKYRFISYDVSDGRLSVRYVHTHLTNKGRNHDTIRISIGSKIKSFKKINVDRLGNEYITDKEKFVTEFKSIK